MFYELQWKMSVINHKVASFCMVLLHSHLYSWNKLGKGIYLKKNTLCQETSQVLRANINPQGWIQKLSGNHIKAGGGGGFSNKYVGR